MGNILKTHNSPKQSPLVCAGCEELASKEDDRKDPPFFFFKFFISVSDYLGKKYCKPCLVQIRDNNRRTSALLQRTLTGKIVVQTEEKKEENE